MTQQPTKSVGLSEVAEMLGVSRQLARARIAAAEDFPASEQLRMGKVWQRADVERWIGKTGSSQ
jgi:predicted DNA-binding transcriptional regulator AlpA